MNDFTTHLPLLPLCIAAVLLANAPRASAHQGPAACDSTGPGIDIEAFARIRRRRPTCPNTVTDCETGRVRATVIARPRVARQGPPRPVMHDIAFAIALARWGRLYKRDHSCARRTNV